MRPHDGRQRSDARVEEILGLVVIAVGQIVHAQTEFDSAANRARQAQVEHCVPGRHNRRVVAIQQFIVEVNNLANRENITALNTAVAVDSNGLATPGASYLQPSSTVLEKRIVQFGIRVDW